MELIMKLSKEELSRLYREQTRRAADDREGCLSNEMLLSASAGKMTDAERGRVAEHLAACSDCATEYRLVRSIRAELSQTATAATEPEQQGARRTFASAAARKNWFHATPPLVSALAASLLIAAVALGGWVLSLQRESRRLAAQVDARDRSISDTQRELSEAATQIAQLRRDVDAFSQPQLNVPIVDLDPRVRGIGTASRPIRIPANTNVFTLVLTVEGQTSFPDYALEILDSSGTSIWSGRGLSKSAFDTFTLAIPTRLLKSGGQYRLMLYGLRDSRKQLIEDYRVEIQYQ
jgi:hypothetical protein